MVTEVILPARAEPPPVGEEIIDNVVQKIVSCAGKWDTFLETVYIGSSLQLPTNRVRETYQGPTNSLAGGLPTTTWPYVQLLSALVYRKSINP